MHHAICYAIIFVVHSENLLCIIRSILYYVITHYYNTVDAHLRDNLDAFSEGLHAFIKVMYSITKLTPQFLGKLFDKRHQWNW